MSNSASAPISVLLVDDHQLVLAGIRVLLQDAPDLVVAATASSGTEALRQLRAHPQVRVAVVDLNLPDMSGVELTRLIRAEFANVQVLALSVFHDYASVREVLEAGGQGYLLKNTNPTELCAAIQRVAAGRPYFHAEVALTLLDHGAAPLALNSGDPSGGGLTPREREVLQLIAGEYPNADIARKLFISERTVETHRKNIFTKTNSKSIVGLIQYALRHNLISG